MVEISVQDPVTLHERVFCCALGPLLTHMRYFEPVIKRQMGGAKVPPSSSAAASVLTLRARCDHVTFQWLIDWMSGKSPPITKSNVVSICLSSSFLQMQELFDNALMFLGAHLQDIVLSTFDLRSLPTHLVLRLSHVVRDTDLAAILIRLYEEQSADHPNRTFVASLLQHYACRQVGVVDSAEDIRPTAASMTGTDHVDQNGGSQVGLPVTSGGEFSLPSTCSLRWCRLCGGLFDEGEMHRLCRASKLSVPKCPSVGGQTPCVGPRGELFTTHTASRRAMPIVLETPPALKGGGVSAFPPNEKSRPLLPAELERWAWRIIGATRFVGCRRCFHLVNLLDVPKHQCSDLPQRFSSLDNATGDITYLVRWFNYCAEKGVYEQEGGLTPMQYRGPPHILAEEVVGVPTLISRCTANTTASEAARRKGKRASGMAATGVVVEGSPDGSPTTAPTSQHTGNVSFWATVPFYASEVMSKNVVDIDIINYVERQRRFEIEAQQRKASVAQNSVLMCLSISPAVAGTPGSRAGTQLASSSSFSPRPLSTVSGAVGRGRVDVSGTQPRTVSSTSRYGLLTSSYRL
ncbi:hypothetical protein JKF63_03586 [Porcisia hertigi]|uniref:SANT and BTB domain-containing protein n=1 Tax=Porcisia hertigi TaxID=2761500 RepID=A0A836I8P3_9TRYP|nr:hypothetical protein JKF63_03586 [Porcisia hertigi]